MKKVLTFLVFLILVLTLMSHAQTYKGKPIKIEIERWAISTITTDTLTLKEAQEFFTYTDQVFSKSYRIRDRYLITPTATYYRTGIVIFNRKPRTWVLNETKI